MIKKHPTLLNYVKICMVFSKLNTHSVLKFLTVHNGRCVITDNLEHHHSIDWPTGISDMEWDRKHSKSYLKDIPVSYLYIFLCIFSLPRYKNLSKAMKL